MTEKGWTENIVLDVWSGFREYWQNGKGKNIRREDWAATWRNWYRKEKISAQREGAQHGSHTGFKQQDYRAGTEGFDVS